MVTKYRNHHDIPILNISTQELEKINTDYTGTNPNFKITNELIKKDSINQKTFCLRMGAFFDESVVVASVKRVEQLVNGVDYDFKVLDSAATGAACKEVHCLIRLREEPTSDLMVSYQYIGGESLHQRDSIISLLKSVDAEDLDKIYYSQLLNRPFSMNVGLTHKHDASNVVGMDEEVVAISALSTTLTSLVSTINTDTSPVLTEINTLINHLTQVKQEVHDEKLLTSSKDIVAAINELFKRANVLDEDTTNALNSAVTSLTNNITEHKDDKNNPHGTNKAQVGLGSVNNYGATSDVTVNDEHTYATSAAAHLAYTKAVTALNKTIDHWNYTATGGERVIDLPYSTPDVDSIQIQGVGQVRNKAWEFLPKTNQVKFAEGLDTHDEVVITIGVPDLDSLNIISKLQSRIDYLESIAGGDKPLEVYHNVFPEDSNTFDIPPQFNKKSIKLVFVNGVQQALNGAYEIHKEIGKIIFSENITGGVSICIVG